MSIRIEALGNLSQSVATLPTSTSLPGIPSGPGAGPISAPPAPPTCPAGQKASYTGGRWVCVGSAQEPSWWQKLLVGGGSAYSSYQQSKEQEAANKLAQQQLALQQQQLAFEQQKFSAGSGVQTAGIPKNWLLIGGLGVAGLLTVLFLSRMGK